MPQSSEPSNKSVLVLLAPGFEESQIAHYISSMRKNHVPVSLVGLSAQHVSGMHGLAFQPDCSLNQLSSDKNYPLVLIAGGYRYLSSLMADPRVHKLLGTTLQHSGYVAADKTAESIIPYTNAQAILTGQQFITPNKMNREQFVQRLICLAQQSPLST